MSDPLRGVLAILLVPFHENGDIDWVSYEKEVEHCLGAGVHGLVVPAVASEFYALETDERRELFERLADRVQGRLPLVAAVSAAHWRTAHALARHAASLGAAAVMAMPPYIGHNHKPGLDAICEYFDAVAQADVPIVYQNTDMLGSTALAPERIEQVMGRVGAIRYIKEEGAAAPQRMTAMRAAVERHGVRMIGGAGGTHLMAEASRGCVAWMPAAEFADILASIVEAMWSGDNATAWARYRALLPALVLENLLGMVWAKAVLQRRGVFSSKAMRGPSPRWGEPEEADLDRVWPDLEALWRGTGR